jgi:hypothetical protein
VIEPGRLEPACVVCSTVTGAAVLSRTDKGWSLSAIGLGTPEPGAVITDERAALVCAAIEDPAGTDRLWSAGLDEVLGFCLRCGAFYCKAHWRAGYCPRGHLMSIDI